MLNKVYFKYREHPGDLFRSKDLIELPNPDNNKESFLIQFLKHYQSDERIAYINDLYKLLDNEFSTEKDKIGLIKLVGNKTKQEIQNEIENCENELKKEAYENFYNLVITNQIDLIAITKSHD